MTKRLTKGRRRTNLERKSKMTIIPLAIFCIAKTPHRPTKIILLPS